MSQLPDHETRITRLETRLDEVAADARTARHLAAGGDRDLTNLSVRVDANRVAIDTLGEQTRERLDRLESKVDVGLAEMRVRFAHMDTKFREMDRGFAETRHGFGETTDGLARIEELITAQGGDR